MREAYICDAVRTPIGRYGGVLSAIRADDLAALPIRELMRRNPHVEWDRIDDVVLGSANQAGEDNRNIGRIAALLAGLPESIPGTTVNRLCGSGLDAISIAARAIRAGEADLMIAGGSESMSRAPFVTAKAETPFARDVQTYDTTIGWRFVNPAFERQYGVDSMPETAENVAAEFGISREDQDAFALRSQQRAAAAQRDGAFDDEIFTVHAPQKRGEPKAVERDEHVRADTSLAALARLSTPFRRDGTVTAGNSSGINDGACALIVASEEAIRANGLTAKARIAGTAAAGVAPRIMGIGPAPATRKLLERLNLSLDRIDVIELNEAFASQSLAVLRMLGIPDDAPHVNAHGGAIALGHPLGMSGARLATTAMYELLRTKKRYALCTMCIGVGQGIATVLERA